MENVGKKPQDREMKWNQLNEHVRLGHDVGWQRLLSVYHPSMILRKYQQACLQLSEDNETPLLRHCSSGYTSFLPVVIDFGQK